MKSKQAVRGIPFLVKELGYTETGSPLKVKAPDEAGECEIRYQSGDGDKVLFRIAIEVE